MSHYFLSDFSEERLAAYIDGRLSHDEMVNFKKEISNNHELNDLVEEISNADLDSSNETAIDDYPDFLPDDSLDQLIPFVEESIINYGSINDPHIGHSIPQAVFNDGEEYTSIDPQSHDVQDFEYIENNKTLEIMGKTSANYRIWGESGENIKDPIFIAQPDDHSCALRSQQIVLRDFGIDIPFEDLERIALDAGVYTEDGTYRCDIGKVLELAGVGMHQVEGSTIYDLTNELAQGHRVIVSVDASELWYNDSLIDRTSNWLNDVCGNQGGNHALIVAGVEVNPDDPNDVKVVLTDPGAGDLRIEYPLEQFMDAWQDSNCFMAATDAAAPFQYDAQTGMEVPSNFATQQFYNQFVMSNSYQLNPDMINIPSDYQPAYNGHLDMLGDVKYDDFQEKYEDLQGARQGGESSNSIVGNAINSLIADLKGLFPHHESSLADDHNAFEHSHIDDNPDEDPLHSMYGLGDDESNDFHEHNENGEFDGHHLDDNGDFQNGFEENDPTLYH